MDRLLQHNPSLSELQQSKQELCQIEVNFQRMQSVVYATTWRNMAERIVAQINNIHSRMLILDQQHSTLPSGYLQGQHEEENDNANDVYSGNDEDGDEDQISTIATFSMSGDDSNKTDGQSGQLLDSKVADSEELPRLPSQKRRGPPRLNIDKGRLEKLLALGVSVREISRKNLLGGKVHRNTLSNFMTFHGMVKPRERFSKIDDEELKDKIKELNSRYPNSGYREMVALLRTQTPPLIVQREKVRKVLALVDPVGTAQRWATTINRRTYSVPTPNSLWHLDSHHKLIRYRPRAIYSFF